MDDTTSTCVQSNTSWCLSRCPFTSGLVITHSLGEEFAFGSLIIHYVHAGWVTYLKFKSCPVVGPKQGEQIHIQAECLTLEILLQQQNPKLWFIHPKTLLSVERYIRTISL